ncbi:MAG: cation diffusion facilitator family transporter [Candidatus Desulfofervidus auxilii]|nr:cation diffusion facilitator family transporter [Candidatus Desulfofervidus auxilii]
MECSEKVAVYSVFFNTSLVILKYFFAQFSGSLAIMADAIHSLTDVIASLAILVGIKISKRQSKQFPYGLYKVENLVSLAMSILIIWVGFEIIKIAFGRECQIKTTQLPLTLFGIFLIIIFTFLFSKYEYNVGERLNSPSLISDAQHIKADMLSTVVVFAGLIGEYLNVHLDRTVAFLVALFVIKAGGKIFIESIKILLEASLDASTLEKVKNIVLSHPAVKEIKEIRGRSSGRYKFIELILILKVSEFKKAHSVTEEIEKKIKEEILGVDHVLIHYEPLERD